MSKLILPNVNQLDEPFQVLAFDPGGTTGWAVCLYRPPTGGADPTLNDFRIATGEFIGPHHKELYDFIVSCKRDQGVIPTRLVCEPFDFRQFARAEGDSAGKSKLELVSREYIGIVTLASQQLRLPLELRFKAGESKTWCPDEKLDKLGWLQRPVHPNRHKNDALRQLVKDLVVNLKVRYPLTTKWTDD